MSDSRIAEAPVEQVGGHILSLLLTVFTSIFEVFLLCFAGYVLAWRGILDKRTIKQVNRLNISLFTPSLVFSKVAFFLSPEKLRELWVIPIFFAIVTFVSMAVSFLLSTVFRLQRQQRNFTLAASMFMNSNSLPVALMQSLVVTLPALKQKLNPDADDDTNAMVGRALTYLLLYSTIGMVLRWSVGWHLLTESSPNREDAAVVGEAEETSALIGNELPTPRSASQKATEPPSSLRRSHWFNPKSPEASREHLALHPILPQSPASELESDEAALLGQDKEGICLPETAVDTSPIHAKFSLRAYRFCLSVNSFMTAPLWASLASILVACITPLQLAFVEHMHPVKTALSSAGNCSIPTTLVVLGAYFYVPSSASGDDSAGEKDTNGPGAAEIRPSVTYPGETKAVIISVVSRMLLTPLLMLPLMALCAQIDRQPFNDPIFVVAMVLLVSSPPALTLAQISQAASGDAFERLISRTIFWAYCIVTPISSVAYAVVGLRLSRL
ncbi:auxin efflux carrier [Favolaschia claudopus]|uniref:Auxin efflux carrier n=1 Tax=Favolaschia claudopus TaxID=2862362 RepID=A0AAW0BZ05_9AGAR